MKQKYKCSFCEQEYNQKWRMSRHLRTTHFGEKLYPCHLCPYSGESKRKLTTHHKNVHNLQYSEIPNARRHVTKNVQDAVGASIGQPVITQATDQQQHTTYQVVTSGAGAEEAAANAVVVSTAAGRQIIVQEHS